MITVPLLLSDDHLKALAYFRKEHFRNSGSDEKLAFTIFSIMMTQPEIVSKIIDEHSKYRVAEGLATWQAIESRLKGHKKFRRMRVAAK